MTLAFVKRFDKARLGMLCFFLTAILLLLQGSAVLCSVNGSRYSSSMYEELYEHYYAPGHTCEYVSVEYADGFYSSEKIGEEDCIACMKEDILHEGMDRNPYPITDTLAGSLGLILIGPIGGFVLGTVALMLPSVLMCIGAYLLFWEKQRGGVFALMAATAVSCLGRLTAFIETDSVYEQSNDVSFLPICFAFWLLGAAVLAFQKKRYVTGVLSLMAGALPMLPFEALKDEGMRTQMYDVLGTIFYSMVLLGAAVLLCVMALRASRPSNVSCAEGDSAQTMVNEKTVQEETHNASEESQSKDKAKVFYIN